MGYYLEDADPDIHLALQKFLNKRTAVEQRVRMMDLASGYQADEWTRPDKFFDPYIGKDYGGRYSEVLRVGLETLWHDPYRLATQDPGLFDLGWRMIRT